MVGGYKLNKKGCFVIKTKVLWPLGSICLWAALSGPAQAAPSCSIKIHNIERQIGAAKAYGHTHRLRGLQRSLANVQAHCGGVKQGTATQPAVATQAQQQAWHQINLTKQRLVVQQHEMDLNQAIAAGNVPQAALIGLQRQQAEEALARLWAD